MLPDFWVVLTKTRNKLKQVETSQNEPKAAESSRNNPKSAKTAQKKLQKDPK